LLVVVVFLLISARTPILSFAYGLAGIVGYLVLLWLSGDPSIRLLAATFVKKRSIAHSDLIR
jgi:hypothetical protein